MDTTLPRPARGGPPQPPPAVDGISGRDVAFARTLARWLDGAMLDPILGLVLPGVGDLASSAAGLTVVVLAIRRRLPAVIIARMLLNLAVDAAVGSVPIAGDLFDLFHRAHRKNAELFTARSAGSKSSWRDWLVVIAAGVAFVVALALPVYVAYRVITALL
jgi:Domain of unknown function (DUF4112)